MRPDGIETFVGGFSRHHRVLAHLKKLHEGLTHGAVVFDNEDDWSCLTYHAQLPSFHRPKDIVEY
jgi:hypothetical protein